MTARRILLLALLLAAASFSAWAQPGPFTITPTTLPVGGGELMVGQMITPMQLHDAQNLSDTFTWSLSFGNLPTGLGLDAVKGAIEGTPTQAGAFTFTITAVEVGTNFTASQQYTLYVSSGPLTLTPLSAPQGAAGVAYSGLPFQVSGGVPNYSWSLVAGSTSDGLTVDGKNGQVSGTPVAGGLFFVREAVTDAFGTTTAATFSLNVLGITTNALPNGTAGTAYSQAFAATGGTGLFSWVVTGSSLPPPGLTLSTQGQLTGTPTANGTFPFTVQVTDSASQLSSSKLFLLTVTGGLTITTTSLPGGTVGTAYSQTLAATGSTNPLTWALSGTAPLPPGLNISNLGVISGTPTQAGSFPFQVQATDPLTGANAVQALSIAVFASVSISPGTLPNGVVNILYPATTLTIPGFTTSNWQVSVGTLPAGLNLDASTGVISGTPTVAGTSKFSISANAASRTSIANLMQTFTVVISATPSVTITGLPSIGVAATQSSATVALSGGTYPLNISGTMTLTFAPAAGGSQNYDAKFGTGTGTTASFTIPAGSTQGLFGTATSVPVIIGTVAGTITITTTAQDSAGTTISTPTQSITVLPAVPVVTGVSPGATTSSGFSISVTGRSTPRNMASAVFHFTSPTGTSLASADVTVPLTSAFTTWYGSAASIPFGSSFTMTVQFSFTGPAGETVPYTTVTVTLTNSVGSSTTTPPVSP